MFAGSGRCSRDSEAKAASRVDRPAKRSRTATILRVRKGVRRSSKEQQQQKKEERSREGAGELGSRDTPRMCSDGSECGGQRARKVGNMPS